MKVPKMMNSYCSKCNTHTEHTVSLYKKGRDRSLAEGNRRYKRKKEGYGGQRKPRQRKTAKTSKHQTLILKCNVCGRMMHRLKKRLKKIEISS